jgi:hypothetical protein
MSLINSMITGSIIGVIFSVNFVFSVDNEPVISYQYELVLPARMQKVLDEFDPAFKPWNIGDYNPMYIEGYHYTDKQALSIVIGDFNGDGVKDVAMDGYNETDNLFICILSDGGKHHVLEINRIPLSDIKESKLDGIPGVWTYLYFVPRDTFLWPMADSLKLQGDAIGWILDGKGEGFYCYQEGKFVFHLTGD